MRFDEDFDDRDYMELQDEPTELELTDGLEIITELDFVLDEADEEFLEQNHP